MVLFNVIIPSKKMMAAAASNDSMVKNDIENGTTAIEEAPSSSSDNVSKEKETETPVQNEESPTIVRNQPEPKPVKPIPIGDYRIRSKLKFEVVTARVVEIGGKKRVVYTVMIKRAGSTPESRPAVIDRRYNDFCYVYECILRSFHPSILGEFIFPRKVLMGNFKAEVITERTDAFHKFLNLIAVCDSLLYSDYFYSFLSSDEHNEAVSLIKLCRFEEAVPLLETIFNIREKLLTISSPHVLTVLCELIACQDAVGKTEDAFAYAQVASKAFDLQHKSGNPDIEQLKVPFLLTAVRLAETLGHPKRAFEKQLSELRYTGVKIVGVKSLLDVVKEKYIHWASHSSK